MRTTRTLTALAIAATALTLTACGGSTAAQPARATGNIRVCQHYRTQRTYVQNTATPTLADTAKVEAWVALDAQQATPGTALKRDLSAMSAAQLDANTPASAVYDASARVLHDCTALGVTFQP